MMYPYDVIMTWHKLIGTFQGVSTLGNIVAGTNISQFGRAKDMC